MRRHDSLLFSAPEQHYGVANYGKAVWFKRILCHVVQSIWRRLGVGGDSPSSYQLGNMVLKSVESENTEFKSRWRDEAGKRG
ncbi:MAG: hypothetical protein B6D35_00520 [Candidatus Brocadia sp. UTAMX2]|nr:MAG: hypothetical protein B6D35_00520 [Candidatus Brocadia sp. UTAMX2]